MKFSVIVPFFNEERHIEKCARALLDQDFDPGEYQIIFVDNMSTDRSRDIVRQFSRVVLLREERRSSYAARNRGIAAAAGEIIAFTDADCTVASDWLAKIQEALSAADAAIVLGRRYFAPDSSPAAQIFADYENAKMEYVLRGEREYWFGYTNNMAVKAEVCRKLSGFVGWERSGDTEFVHRYLVEFPDAQVKYASEMKIFHLEIRTLRDWFAKLMIYGQTNSRLAKISGYRQLGWANKLRIYRYCVRQNRYRPGKRLLLFIFLAIGALYYSLGKAGIRCR